LREKFLRILIKSPCAKMFWNCWIKNMIIHA
jgi:hypothetical protein